MNLGEIVTLAEKLMGPIREVPHEQGYRLHHGKRVADLAMLIAKEEKLDLNLDILIVSGLLHDIGKNKSKNVDDGVVHGPKGAEIVRERFSSLMTEEELEQVCDIITNHNSRPHSKWYDGKERPVLSNEILVIQDADLLDHFGEAGVNIILKWAKVKNTPLNTLYNEWINHPLKISWREESRSSINFEFSRAELERRIEYMNVVLSELK